MQFESKVLSKQISERLYGNNVRLGTAESCTGGKIAEAIIATPGSSKYFTGGIIAYSDEVKERLLHVPHQLIEEKTAFSEEVAIEMVKGVCQTLGCDYAIASTGVAGPGGGTDRIPVGTIWLAYGTKDDVRTFKLSENDGRDINLMNATHTALRLFLKFINEKNQEAAVKR